MAYHDREWGVPLREDTRLFELLVLEGAQAGLSWSTVLKKREGYRELFDGFDPNAVARFDRARLDAIVTSPTIIRNRAKVESAVGNAAAFLQVSAEFGSFAAYLWEFVDGVPLQPRRRFAGDIPAETEESHALSRDLRKRGFRFVGPTICYAYMQSAGLVNDHLVDCFRHQEVMELSRPPLDA